MCVEFFVEFLYFSLISVGLVIISPISFLIGNFCLLFLFLYQFSQSFHFIYEPFCHFVFWSFQRTRCLLIDFSVLISVFNFSYFCSYFYYSFSLLVLGLFWSFSKTFRWSLDYWFKIFPLANICIAYAVNFFLSTVLFASF